MKIIQTFLNDVKVIKLDCHSDNRGFFMEIYSQKAFDELGINAAFVQDNCSRSLKRGTIRGLHYQKVPYAQGKLIRCTRGSFYDLAVDVRKGSPTFGQATTILLEEDDQKLVWIPRGFAHGVAIVKDNSEYNYKVDSLYNGEPENNGGVSYAYDFNQLNWNILLPNTEIILSPRDIEGVAKTIDEIDTNFIYGENC